MISLDALYWFAFVTRWRKQQSRLVRRISSSCSVLLLLHFTFTPGADIVNDISGGLYDAEMFKTVAALGLFVITTYSPSLFCCCLCYILLFSFQAFPTS
jgi:hypothetical protein